MRCKNCKAKNDDRANFCVKCGSELHKNTVVTSAAAQRLTATNVPTSGIRVFSGIGNGYLQSAAMSITSVSDAMPKSDTYHTHTTGAKVRLRANGTWICPDCGEENTHDKLWCMGCGKYR